MAKRSDSVLGSGIVLILGAVFVLFWITTATTHGAPVFFPLFGLVFLGVLVATLGKDIFKTLGERTRNEAAPAATSAARVLTKRTEVTSRGKSHSTAYYATFDLASGERLELELTGDESGLLVEGDRGELRYQGTWFLGFERSADSGSEVEPAAGENRLCEYCGALNVATARRCCSCGSGKLVTQTSSREQSPAGAET